MRRCDMRASGALAILAICAAALTACPARQGADPAGPEAARAGEASYWPTRSWKSSAPEAQGVDPAKLAAALDSIGRGDQGIHSLLVVRNGYLVSETYFDGGAKDRLAALYSITKSVVSTLVGIAVDRGEIADLALALSDEALFGPLGDSDPRKRAVSLENLLTMTSGLDWTEGDAAYRAFYMADDSIVYEKSLPMASEPGAAFNYDSGAVHLLAAALRRGTGSDPADYARRHLFGPLGIRRFEWEKDRKGLSLGGWGLKLSPRDMAKLGYLFLREGEWEGKRVVSREWVEAATTPRVADTGSPQRLGYGYLWWTTAEFGGYAALGLGGQTILVVPGLDLVVVVTAWTPDRGHGGVFSLLREYILPAARP